MAEKIINHFQKAFSDMHNASGKVFIGEPCISYSGLMSEGDAASQTSAQAPAAQKILEDIIKALVVLIEKIALRETSRIFADERIKNYETRTIVPYIAAINVLDFSGRDVDMEGVSRLIEATGSIPDNTILSYLASLHIKNSIVYAAALYLIVVNGREPTVESLIEVVRALDVHPDATLAGYAITLYRLYKNATL